MTDPIPYALTAVGLFGGLIVISVQPFPSATLNWALAAVLLGGGFGAILYLIAQGSGPDRRGPDFE